MSKQSFFLIQSNLTPYSPGSKRCSFHLLVALCLEIRQSRAQWRTVCLTGQMPTSSVRKLLKRNTTATGFECYPFCVVCTVSHILGRIKQNKLGISFLSFRILISCLYVISVFLRLLHEMPISNNEAEGNNVRTMSQFWNNVATHCCAKSRRYESSCVCSS